MEVNRANADLDERYDSVDPLNKSREDCGFGRSFGPPAFPSRHYLENRYARTFGESPLQFSNEAPAVIWNLSLPA